MAQQYRIKDDYHTVFWANKEIMFYIHNKIWRKNRSLSAEYGYGSRQTYAYDEVGNRINSTDRLGNETAWKYDAAGRVVEETRPGGLVTTSQYDENGDLVLEQGDARHRAGRLYDGNHNMVRVRERTGSGENERVTSYSYDRL